MRFVPPIAIETSASTSTLVAEEASRDRRDKLLKSGRRLSRRASNLQKIPLTNQIIEQELTKNEKKQRLRWYHTIFLLSGASLIVCLLQLYLPPPFGVMMSSAEIKDIGVASNGCEDGLDHCICPRETICATNILSITLLTLARCSAYFDYPLYMMMFLSKCHNINNISRRTVLREWIDFADMHKVHKLFGVVIGVETMSHSFFHVLRWCLNGDINLLLGTKTGITGVITVIITPLVVWPMVVPILKKKIPFEVRKGLHYLVIVWAIALLWHAPSRIYYLIGVPALIYVLDYLFGFFIRNTLIENAYFERYGENGVAVSFNSYNFLAWHIISISLQSQLIICQYYKYYTATLREPTELGRETKDFISLHYVSLDFQVPVACFYHVPRTRQA